MRASALAGLDREHANLKQRLVSVSELRPICSSHAIMAGVDLYTLAKILGHRNLDMGQGYTDLTPDHLQTATRRATPRAG